MTKMKNVHLVIEEYSNCYDFGIEIHAYTASEQRAPKKNWLAIACCPKIESKMYSLANLSDEESEEDYEELKELVIDDFIWQFVEERNIDPETVKISY